MKNAKIFTILLLRPFHSVKMGQWIVDRDESDIQLNEKYYHIGMFFLPLSDTARDH